MGMPVCLILSVGKLVAYSVNVGAWVYACVFLGVVMSAWRGCIVVKQGFKLFSLFLTKKKIILLYRNIIFKENNFENQKKSN